MVLAHSFAAAQDGAERSRGGVRRAAVRHPTGRRTRRRGALVWEDRPGNVAYHWRHGDDAGVQAALGASPRVVRLTSRVSRVAAMPMEPRAALAYTGEDGRPVVRLRTRVRTSFATKRPSCWPGTCGPASDHTRCRRFLRHEGGGIARGVAGVLGIASVGQPVRWAASRGETFLADEHARDVVIHAELGLDAEGRFSALRIRYEVNVGAYMSWRSTAPVNNIGGISGVYVIPATSAEVLGVFTNTHPTAPYRGAGRPDATYAIERVIDVAAAEIGMDAAELRRRNLIPASAMPYRTSFRFEYDCGELRAQPGQGAGAGRLRGFCRKARRGEAARHAARHRYRHADRDGGRLALRQREADRQWGRYRHVAGRLHVGGAGPRDGIVAAGGAGTRHPD